MLSYSGVDIEHIADAVGHVNSTITKAVYRHQIADKVTVAATAMDAISARRAGRENRAQAPSIGSQPSAVAPWPVPEA